MQQVTLKLGELDPYDLLNWIMLVGLLRLK